MTAGLGMMLFIKQRYKLGCNGFDPALTIFESHSNSLAIRGEGHTAPGLFQHLEADQLVVAFVRPDAHASVVAHCGVHGFVGVDCQSPQLSLLVTLGSWKENKASMNISHVTAELSCVLKTSTLLN